MRLLRILFLIAGAALLGLLIAQTDLSETGAALATLGFGGFVLVTAVFGVAFLLDTASWHLMLPSTQLTGSWLLRLFRVRLIGEAFNLVLPLASFGGEPVKAVLLKRDYGLSYHESAASLVIARTTNLLALCVFSLIGVVILLGRTDFPSPWPEIVIAGLVGLSIGSFGFFIVQRWNVSSRLASFVKSVRVRSWLAHLEIVDQGFVAFYRDRWGRFAAALGLAFLNWTVGTIEIWLTVTLLGGDISFFDAWLLETVVQLVRAGTFFIPANLGSLEASILFVTEIMTGSAGIGLAAAAVRRVRELVWIGAGLAAGWGTPMRQNAVDSQETP